MKLPGMGISGSGVTVRGFTLGATQIRRPRQWKSRRGVADRESMTNPLQIQRRPPGGQQRRGSTSDTPARSMRVASLGPKPARTGLALLFRLSRPAAEATDQDRRNSERDRTGRATYKAPDALR